MTVADYRRKWVEARLDELRASGLKDAAIARRMGISHAWYSEALKKEEIGDAFVKHLCKGFGLTFRVEQDAGSDLSSQSQPEPKEIESATSRRLDRLTDVLDRVTQELQRERARADRYEQRVRELEERYERPQRARQKGN